MSEVEAVNANNASGDENSQVGEVVMNLRSKLIGNILSNVHVMFRGV